MITKEAVRQACKSQRAALSIADCESWAPKLCHEIVQLPISMNRHNRLWPIWQCRKKPTWMML